MIRRAMSNLAAEALAIKFAKARGILLETARKIVDDHRNETFKWKHIPVGIREFVTSPEYMNAPTAVYPRVMNYLEEMNTGQYTEVVFTGSIGSAKTTGALYTTAYQLYRLSCLVSPHAEYDLDPASEIVMVFQSLNYGKAREVGYDRFQAMINASPYFQHHFPYNHRLDSQMRFGNRIIVKPVTGSETATIGENVIGGCIDEVNYMQVTEGSSRTSGNGEAYDQAMAVYNSLALRRKNRFMKAGIQPGILCLISSRRYPGQFTDKKEEEAKHELLTTGKTSIYIYDKCAWDIHEPDRYSGVWFNVFVGDLTRKTYIMGPDEMLPEKDHHLIKAIPEEYRKNFELDMGRSLRDIAGVATLASHPFIYHPEKVSSCFGRNKSVLSLDLTDMITTMPMVYPKRFKNPDNLRWVHIDLGVTNDAAGIACGTVHEFMKVNRGRENETLPVIEFDFMLRVKPPKNGEISFEKIRALLYLLRDQGLNIQFVTLDSFQSVDTLQILRGKGMTTGRQSIDRDAVPYDCAKLAFYDGRVICPGDDYALREWVSLEYDAKRGKVDHPPTFTKDLSDSMAGVIYGLTTRVEIWARHGIPVVDIPASIKQISVRAEHMRDEDLS